MNTWTCKVCALLLGSLTLAACEGGLPGAGPDEGIRSAPLGQGAVMLVAPSGFCIDARSLRARFALMARCDTLGANGAGDAPLALITATTVPTNGDGPIVADDLGGSSETVLERADRDGLTLAPARGTPPSPEPRAPYWRAAARVGDQITALATYEAQDGAPLGPRAPRLLEQTMQRTQDQTVAITVARADNSATPPDNNPRPGLLGGLFE